MADKSIVIEIASSGIPVFNELLQSGFMINTKSGISIEDFLCDQMGIDPKYINERVKTVVLDFRPVDNLEEALLPSLCPDHMSEEWGHRFPIVHVSPERAIAQ